MRQLTRTRAVCLLALLAGLTCATASASASPLVSLRGGPVVPGGQFHLVVARSGRCVLKRGSSTFHRFRISTRRLATLRAEIRASHFGSLKRTYRYKGKYPLVGAYPDVAGYDHHVVTIEPGAKPPHALTKLVDSLDAIVDAHS